MSSVVPHCCGWTAVVQNETEVGWTHFLGSSCHSKKQLLNLHDWRSVMIFSTVCNKITKEKLVLLAWLTLAVTLLDGTKGWKERLVYNFYSIFSYFLSCQKAVIGLFKIKYCSVTSQLLLHYVAVTFCIPLMTMAVVYSQHWAEVCLRLQLGLCFAWT